MKATQADRKAAREMLNHAFRNAPDNCTDFVQFEEIAEAFARHRNPEPVTGNFVLGPVWREEEEESECWTAEVQALGGYEVVATVHGGSEEQATARANAIIAALAKASPSLPTEDERRAEMGSPRTFQGGAA